MWVCYKVFGGPQQMAGSHTVIFCMDKKNDN